MKVSVYKGHNVPSLQRLNSLPNLTLCKGLPRRKPRFLTFRGSALYTPSTSVQIVMRPARNNAPMIAALKSDPSRFSVVGMPSGVRATNPVTMIVSAPFSVNHWSSRASESS